MVAVQQEQEGRAACASKPTLRVEEHVYWQCVHHVANGESTCAWWRS